MSINRNYYVIAGYDLTSFRTEKYESWKWTPEGENMTNNQRKGQIQFFDDPMDGSHLYLGYVLASGDEYEFPTTKISFSEVERLRPYAKNKVEQLFYDGVFPNTMPLQDLKYEVFVFEECS